jgi:hypothetical protein
MEPGHNVNFLLILDELSKKFSREWACNDDSANIAKHASAARYREAYPFAHT